MTEPIGKVLEGVFAINKPPSVSSAQVLRELQHAFRLSKTFTPLLRQTEAQERQNKFRSKRRRLDNDNAFKMGHGGTLDPMATGVLIVGVGRGTKSLSTFLDCTKTYETVVLFGKSTDTYDVAGKVVATASTSQITREMVEEKLQAFRGNIKQIPPIYSALKIDGMKAYDYARTGRELPRQLAARDMKVDECSLIDWYEPGQHDFRWPAEEVPAEEKAVFSKLVERTKDDITDNFAVESNTTSPTKNPEKTSEAESELRDNIRGETVHGRSVDSRAQKALQHTHDLTGLATIAANAPAARIKLTVSSGFYVRSFAHDLGLACGSYGTMAKLARTRQGAYSAVASEDTSLIPAMQYTDLSMGEEFWSPKITKTLSHWLSQNTVKEEGLQRSDRPFDRYKRRDTGHNHRKRRNSSSPE